MEKLNESVLDPIQQNRCDALFDINDKSEKPKIKKEARDFIIGLLNKFREETGLQFNYDQAFIVGSSLGYQYRDDSDIDVNIRTDIGRDFFKGKFHMIPKNVMLPNTAHPVNIFLLTKDDPEYNFEKDAENAYDLITDTWIKQGKLSNAMAIPFEYVAGVSEFIMNGMSLELQKSERDMYDMEKYLRLDPNKVAITIKDICDAISKKISDLIIDKDALALAHTMLFRLERDGFNDQPINVSIKYTHDSKHYSMNNLIYKYVDSFQYYDKINAKINEINKLIEKAKKHLKDSQELLDATPEAINNAEVEAEVKEQTVAPEEAQQPQEQQETAEMPQEEAPKQEAEVSEDTTEQAVEESWTDNELRNILIENNYYDDSRSLKLLKENLNKNLILIPGSDPDLKSLEEDLSDKTENQLNQIIYKKSGKVNEIVTSGLGFLIGGPIGALLAYPLTKSHNLSKDDAHYNLQNEVNNDPECSEVVEKIKKELSNENPDKKVLKDLKKEFAQCVVKCKKNMKENEKRAANYNKINLKESLSDKELLDILLNNGFKANDSNLKILKENKDYILEGGDNYED